MTIRDIECLTVVYDTNSIVQAAQILSVSQSALSQTIKKLENELSCTLFVKNGRGIRPSDYCRMIISQSKSIVEAFDTFVRSIKQEAINLGSRLTLYTQSTLCRVLVPYALNIIENNQSNLKTTIIEERSDTIERGIDNLVYSGIGLVQAPLLISSNAAEKVFDTEFLLTMNSQSDFAKKHPFKGFGSIETIDPSDVSDKSFILLENTRFDKLISGKLDSVGFVPKVYMMTNRQNNIADYISHNREIVGFIDEIHAYHFSHSLKNLCFYRIKGCTISHGTYVVYERNRKLSCEENEFIGALKAFPKLYLNKT